MTNELNLQRKPEITVSVGEPKLKRVVTVKGKNGFPMRGGGQRIHPRKDVPRFRGVRDPVTGEMKMERIITMPRPTWLAGFIHAYYKERMIKARKAQIRKQQLANKGI